MIKVLQILGSLGTAGDAAVVVNYYTHMDLQQVEFDFVCCDDPKVKLKHELTIMSRGGRVYHLSSRAKQPLSYIRELKTIIREGNYDIVHINQNSASMAMDAFAAKCCGVKVIIGHSHNTRCNVLWQHYMLRPFVNCLLTHRFACSKEAGKWCFGNKKDVQIINNAVDTKTFAFDDNIRKKVRAELQLDDKLVVGFVGRLYDKQKNISRLLEIFSNILKYKPDACLMICGDGIDKQLLEDKAIALGVISRVLFLGMRHDIAELMSAMDVFVMTSFYEGMPVVCVEAQASGLPLVVSEYVPCSDLLGLKHTVSLQEVDDTWSSNILKDKNQHRENAASTVADKGYDIFQEADRLCHIYKNCLEIK